MVNNIQRIAYTCFVALFIPFLQAKADNISLDAKLDTNQILIGDQLYLTFTIEQSPNYRVNLPTINDTLTKGIEVIDTYKPDTVTADDNNIVIKQKYKITAFEKGLYKIPSYPFAFKYNDRKDTLQSASLELMVNTVPGIDTATTIKDIKAPIEAPVTFKEVMPYIGYSLLGLLVIAIIIFVLKRFKKKQPVFKPRIPEKLPYLIALEELDKLKEDKLWQKNEIKTYYSRLTNIIRAYIERRYDVKAMEETTSEILRDMKSTDLNDRELLEMLKKLLSLADLVKFAKGIPEPEENESHLDNAYTFVLKTKNKPEELQEKQINTSGNE
jgi:hypothetical protein